MMKKFAKLARDDSAAVLIELALAAPMLALMVMGISDISSAFSKRLELEQAAQRAIEKVMQTTGEDTPEGTIKREAVCQYNGTKADGSCKTAPITVDSVTVEYMLTCNNVVTAYNTDCVSGQTEYRYIEATVRDTYTPMFPIHFGTGADGKYSLSATAGVRVA
jgi:Flp pilus assembly protein TadG